MSTSKISELNDLNAAPAADDKLVIVDTSAGETKRIDIEDLNKHPDNVKATFGDSDDLQIYHDGSSRIANSTGNLIISDTDGDIYIQAKAGENSIRANNDGAVIIYFDNAEKLSTTSTGIDVTGTVTADGLTVDGAVTIQEATGTTLTVKNTGDDIATIVLGNTGSHDTQLTQQAGVFTIVDGGGGSRLSIADNGDVSLFENTGTTAKFFWDASAESLGIGTSSPALKGHINGASNGLPATSGTTQTNGVLRLSSSATSGIIDFGMNSANPWIQATDSSGLNNNYNLLLNPNGGNVGIGTSSPSALLHMTGASAQLRIEATSGNSQINFADSADSNIGILAYDHSSNAMTFRTNDAERMRIDSSGNLLVGKTTTDFGVAGVNLESGGNVGVTRSSAAGLNINRLSTDGDIAKFYKDSTIVGSIGSYSGTDIYITGGTGNDHGLVIGDGYIVPSGAAGTTNSNVSLGLAVTGRQFKDLYLSGGVYLGGTGAANKLDDYETGTWTPEIVGSTTAGSYSSTIKIGAYTKVGQMVTVWGYFLGSSGTGAGDLNITGLPFSIATDAVGVIQANEGLVYPSGAVDACLYGSGGTTLQVRCNRSDGTTYSKMLYPTSATYVRFTLTYRTT